MRKGPAHRIAIYSALGLAAIMGVAIVVYREQVLPARFGYDANIIQQIALGEATADAKYTAAAMVYRTLGLAQNATLAGLVSYAFFAATLVAVGARLQWRRMSLATVATVWIGLLLGAIYLGQYSKDVFVLAITLIVICLPPSKWWQIAIPAAMLLYAALMRDYWFFVTGASIGLWIARPYLNSLRMFFAGALVTVALSVAVVVVFRIPADAYRAVVNENRGGLDAGSVINNVALVGEPWNGIISNVVTYFSLALPLPLAVRGGLYYIGSALVIASLWILLLVSEKRYDGDPVARRCFALLIGLLATQALFEPDFGSALRHLTPVLPLFAYVVWRQGLTLREMMAIRPRNLRTATLSEIPSDPT